MITRLQRVAACLLLSALVAGSGMGCSSMRAFWRGKHYVLALCQAVEGRTDGAGKVVEFPALDGAPVKCSPSVLFSSRDIADVSLVAQDKKVTALRIKLDPENRMPWMQLRENMRDGAMAVIVDGTICAAVCPISSDTFSEAGVILLKADWDPVLARQIVKYAETNHMLFHKLREW